MKSAFFLFFILIFSNCQGQETKKLEFIGTLQMPDGIIITYKLTFKEMPDGKIEGVSITDFYGENNTKSKITGFFNNKENKISFHETENISTKSSSEANEFCFIHVKNAKIKTVKEKSIIQGNFKGVYSNDSNCVDGYMYLIGTNFLEQWNNKILNSDYSKNTDSLKPSRQEYAGLLKKTEENQLRNNEILRINWVSEEIILELWDAAKIDQDKITIFINEKKIIEDFVIKREKKIIVIPFKEDICSIKILATSEGNLPTNTVNIVLRDDNTFTPVVTNLNKGETSSVILEKQKKRVVQ